MFLAQEIVEDLRAALAQFEEFGADLAASSDANGWIEVTPGVVVTQKGMVLKKAAATCPGFCEVSRERTYTA